FTNVDKVHKACIKRNGRLEEILRRAKTLSIFVDTVNGIQDGEQIRLVFARHRWLLEGSAFYNMTLGSAPTQVQPDGQIASLAHPSGCVSSDKYLQDRKSTRL